MSDHTIVLVGSGPGIRHYRFAINAPHGAVSSGCRKMGRSPDLFFGCDGPGMFPAHIPRDESISRHIPTMCMPWWRDWNVTLWDTCETGEPNFTDRDAPVMDHRPWSQGDPPAPHSLVFAVQVAALLGFDRLVFAGVDLLEPHLQPIADLLETWAPAAAAAGVEWINISPNSALAGFMPTMCSLEASRCLTMVPA